MGERLRWCMDETRRFFFRVLRCRRIRALLARGRALTHVGTHYTAVSAGDVRSAECGWAKPDSTVLGEVENVQLCAKDLRTLQGNTWLNDEVVNFYCALLRERSQEQLQRGARAPSLHVFSSFFWTRLTAAPPYYDYAGVRRWTKAVDIFAFDLLLIPLNHYNTHWSLCAVFVRDRCIAHFDSLGGDSTVIFTKVMRYLVDEAASKGKERVNEGEWRSIDAAAAGSGKPPTQLPQVETCLGRQADACSCGVFMLAFAERLAAGGTGLFEVRQRDIPAIRIRIAAECLARQAIRAE